MKNCDNMSVGVIIQSPEGAFALLERARFPIGIAPPAGHIDEHGQPEQAAVNEVQEELGLVIALNGLQNTVIQGRRVNNQCRRPGGTHHSWWIYEATKYSGNLVPDAEETRGANWYAPDQLQALADRTKAFQAGQLSQKDWEANPGLEPVWFDFFTELGYVHSL
ncbi:MAG: hydrolase [Candidatus Saccharibacteria bacterium]|nr:hydrolase [Candidatus Saccharibacteria bacterium]